jgi:cytochrome P450
MKQVQSDAMLTVIAGSDTVSTTLSTIFYYLMTNCEAMKRLRQKIDTVFPPGEGYPLDANKLSGMLYLNAVMCVITWSAESLILNGVEIIRNEGLRLGPPLFSARHPVIQEVNGLEQGQNSRRILHALLSHHRDRYAPPGTAINIPAYALHRCAKYFSPSPSVFWPGRWLKEAPSAPSISGNGSEAKDRPFSKVVTNTSAFIPFSFGPANCVGKNLAMVEMRMVVDLLVTQFDMQLSSSYDPTDWDREQVNFSALKNGRLPVILRRRDEV